MHVIFFKQGGKQEEKVTKRISNVAVAWTCRVENVNVTPAGIARDG